MRQHIAEAGSRTRRPVVGREVSPEVSVVVSPRWHALRHGTDGAAPRADGGPSGFLAEDTTERVCAAAEDTPDAAAFAPRGNEAAATARDLAGRDGPDRERPVREIPVRDIRLRRDGRRPLRLAGVPLLRRQVITALGEPEGGAGSGPGGNATGALRGRAPEPAEAAGPIAVQRLDLFLDVDRRLVAATSIDFHGPLPAVPQYRARRIDSRADFEAFVGAHRPAACLRGGAGALPAEDAAGRRLDAAFRGLLGAAGLAPPTPTPTPTGEEATR